MIGNIDKYYEGLYEDLRNLAITDWPTFVQLIGEDAFTSAKICLLKSRGKSLGQISKTLTITKRLAQTRCENCKSVTK